jgi:NAD(P)-dependent dehydrogenase (short-subunit alcohol dehydrogenase family)
MQLTGRRYIVTGAGRGIGLAVADAFLAEGASVAMIDRSFSPEQGRHGQSRSTYICDISQRVAVEATFREATSKLGGLDGLVNAAGVERRSLAEDIDDAEWDEVVNVNLRGTFLTNQIAFSYLREKGGRIVNFGSDSGLIPHPGGAHYAASKGGVIAWTRSIAAEWGKYGITANTVLPAMKTPMYEEHRQRFSRDEIKRFDESIAARLPIGGQLGDPALDLAPVLVFLVSDASHFITGQLISVTGGLGNTR